MVKTKKYVLFSYESNDKIINMEVNKQIYEHFQTLNPLQQKAMQDMMTLQMLKNQLWYMHVKLKNIIILDTNQYYIIVYSCFKWLVNAFSCLNYDIYFSIYRIIKLFLSKT